MCHVLIVDQEPGGYAMKRWLLLFSFVLVFLGLVAFRGYQQSKVGISPQERVKIPVQTTTVTRETFLDKIRFVGSLEPEEQASVVSKLEGRTVLKVLVHEGESVKPGQLMAVLDDSLLRASLRQVEASVARAHASLEQADSRLATVAKDYRRMEKLLAEEVISRQEFDHAEGQYEVAGGAREAAYQLLEEAVAARRELQITLSYHRIEAPVEGVVVRRLIDPGDVSGTSGPAFVINRQNNVKVTGAVPERDFVRLRAGQSALVGMDALNGREFSGIVSRVSPVMDPTTRTGEVEILLPAEGQLKPGMFARVELNIGERESLALPRESVSPLEGTGEWVCYVVSGDRALLRIVDVGLADANRVEVTGGISPGERVIVTRSRFLKDGAEVEVTDR